MELVSRRCSVCDSEDNIDIFHQQYSSIAAVGGEGYSQTIVVCRRCGFTFSNPSPSPEELARYYAMFSNYENPQHQGKESDQMLNKWKRTHEMILRHLPPGFKGRALEIGCATGSGLSTLKSEGWKVLGIEPSNTSAKIAKELYDVEVICSPFDKEILRERGPFDLIILSHVLEHLFMPRSILNDVSTLLEKDGAVYIEVPNLLRPYVPMGYFTFEHLNYFTPTSLSSLMKLCGYSAKLELFDNSADIAPFYPVIAAVGKVSRETLRVVENDCDAVFEAVARYKETSGNATRDIQSKIAQIIKDTRRGRLGIWGAGIHTSQLLSLSGLSNERIACVFDSDPKRHGTRINGVQVTGMESPEGAARMVDSILISSRASENEIYDQIAYLEEYGIRVYKLYNE
jgi:2-polyprenyl-3-methyl-5-hydroxy-6-metoxy-1,4-benzoquinol methylase